MKIYFVILLFSLCCMNATAQNSEQAFQKGKDAFEIGQFEVADSIFNANMEFFSGENKINAYRMLALSSLYQDKQEAAEDYAAKLLALDPYYTAYGDSPRFSNILEKMKKGTTTISTASKMEESLDEVPVPVTLITENMIKASGARNLSELLNLYVPGLSLISSIEDNNAMRGVYGMNQETMLVMFDGHRLNSPSTNAAPLDYSNNLEKIKQIEVLRGPASSLYGNVALTAVINIITKTGNDVGGGKIAAAAGKNKSYGGTLLFGNGNLKTEYLAWASLYTAMGERKYEDNVAHYAGGYNNKPTFDFGAKIRWGDFKISIIGQYSKPVPYHNLLSGSNIYSYDLYAKQNGEKPGTSKNITRMDIDYVHNWKDWSFSASAYATVERKQIYNVFGDTIDSTISQFFAMGLGLADIGTRGVWQTINWEDYSFGSTLTGGHNYKFNNGMSGALLLGLQYENCLPTDGSYKYGQKFNVITGVSNDIIYDDMEHIFSGFMQLKHRFSNKFILNGGLRFDHKIRQQSTRIDKWSPRLTLIWLASPNFSVKGGYSYSFVDAPLFYRASKIALFKGGTELDAEEMKAFQVGTNLKMPTWHLTHELNFFYNNVSSLVFYNALNSSSGDDAFHNAGKINMGGIENVIQYTTDKTLINLNCTYQYPFKIENFSSKDHDVSNVPRFLLNVTASQEVYHHPKAGQLWLRANMHAQSKMDCLYNDILANIIAIALGEQDENQILTESQSSLAVFGAGMEWKSSFGLGLSIDTYNLFNKDYMIGGQLREPVPSQGFSFLGRVYFDF